MKIVKIFPILISFILLFTLKSYARSYNFNAEVSFSFAKAYLEANNYTNAKKELKKCLALNPRHAEAKKLLKLCDKKISPPTKDKIIELSIDSFPIGIIEDPNYSYKVIDFSKSDLLFFYTDGLSDYLYKDNNIEFSNIIPNT